MLLIGRSINTDRRAEKIEKYARITSTTLARSSRFIVVLFAALSDNDYLMQPRMGLVLIRDISGQRRISLQKISVRVHSSGQQE